MLKFENNDEGQGVEPSNITVAGTPLDDDLLGVWMIGKIDPDTTELKTAKKITISTTNGEYTLDQDYDLTGITFVPSN